MDSNLIAQIVIAIAFLLAGAGFFMLGRRAKFLSVSEFYHQAFMDGLASMSASFDHELKVAKAEAGSHGFQVAVRKIMDGRYTPIYECYNCGAREKSMGLPDGWIFTGEKKDRIWFCGPPSTHARSITPDVGWVGANPQVSRR